jgi:hypothetical protein
MEGCYHIRTTSGSTEKRVAKSSSREEFSRVYKNFFNEVFFSAQREQMNLRP